MQCCYSVIQCCYSVARYGVDTDVRERTELERRVRSLKIRVQDARRALVILMLADGAWYSAI